MPPDQHAALALTDARDRNRVRRRFAQAAAGGVILLIGALIFGIMFDAGVTDRIKTVSAEWTAALIALLTYLGHYTHVGSQENRQATALAAQSAPG